MKRRGFLGALAALAGAATLKHTHGSAQMPRELGGFTHRILVEESEDDGTTWRVIGRFDSLPRDDQKALLSVSPRPGARTTYRMHYVTA